MVMIPTESLSPEALRGIVEAFVLREGTDYGHRDFSLDEKCEAVERAAGRGRSVVRPGDPHHGHPAGGLTAPGVCRASVQGTRQMTETQR